MQTYHKDYQFDIDKKYAQALVNFNATKSSIIQLKGVKKNSKFVELKNSKAVLKKLSTINKSTRKEKIKDNKGN